MHIVHDSVVHTVHDQKLLSQISLFSFLSDPQYTAQKQLDEKRRQDEEKRLEKEEKRRIDKEKKDREKKEQQAKKEQVREVIGISLET